MAMECSSSTPDKNDENTLKIVKDNAKHSHSKTLVKKAKLSLFKKSCVAKSLNPDVDLDETGQFQENQASDFRIHIKPVRKPQKGVHSKQEVLDQREGTLNVFKEIIKGEINVDGSEQACPTCRESIPSSQMPSHISLCLKEQFTLVRTNSQDNNEKSKDYQLCQICQKDISHMNSTRRSQHVNHCMDQREAGLKEEENKKRLLTEAKTAILDCPVCGKALKTAQSRKSHMKKCSVKMSVTTEKLLALIKNQEEERNVEIAAGVIPNSLRLLRLKSAAPASNEDKRSKRVTEPKNKLDEQTQLALALSTSIAEQQHIQDQAIVGQKQTNQGKKSRNRKNCAEDIPLILKLNREEAKRRIADRVTQLLLPKTPQNSQENIVVTPPDSSRLDLTDMSVECEIFRSNLLQPRLWTESGLSDKDENGIDKFYVSALMPSVSKATVKAGSKLRRMSTIPGRRNSEELEKEILVNQQKSLEYQQSVDQKKNQVNTTLKSELPLSSSPVVTQTAVLLAELAAEADGSGSHLEYSMIQQQNDDLHNSGFCPEEPIEIHKEILTPCVVSLQQSLLNMVDSPTDSDVTIVTSNRPIPAHKIFLRSRCPQMLQKVTDRNQLDLSSTPSDVVLTVLKYIYSGSVLLNPGCLEGVIHLSSSLGLDELENICQTVMKSRQEHPGTKDTEEEEENGLDVLENLWSSSSEFGSEDEGVKGHSEGGEVKGQDDREEDDWREMFYTQREQIKRQNSYDLLNNVEANDILSDNSENLNEEIDTTQKKIEPKDGTCGDETPCGSMPPNCVVGESDDCDSDRDTKNEEISVCKSNPLDFKAVSGSMDCCVIPKTDDTCSDSEDNCSILDIVDKRRRSNSNSQSSFQDNYLREQCNSYSLPKDVTDDISEDFSNSTSMEKSAADPESEINVDGNNDIFIPQDDFDDALNERGDEEIIQTNFKTPTLSESAKKRRAKKPWVAPSPFTPMPNYDAMNTPQLQKQINKYGLRPACKKRMKDVLSTIYHETHQYETDSDCEIDAEKLNLMKQKVEKIQEKEIKSKKSTRGTKKAPAKQTKTVKKPSSKKITKPPIQTINFPLEGSSDDQLSSSQNSDISDLPEESILAVRDDDDDESDGPKCSKSELHKKLTEYIKSNTDIHIDTLQYIPLEIDIFKKRMTENGIKCSMEKLQEYFDEKCISFTMKNNRKPRKQKRKPKLRRMKVTIDV
ncbi:hypothetical protein LOTGIDRAFT_228558 [Lottia gigantea]|uniref:Structure-specific endonuclease subunit SLX4 n=1 Tax=Lottia gigantea TaxID=225164 RepID=V4AAI8_LOTGI|nr:hypothetical protein LOTGIDRAFT_228558 [Lottia gigantea]ESO93782.1 hypothetical protein LOTGIDRAFT_228558 [Lottia gigantea]